MEKQITTKREVRKPANVCWKREVMGKNKTKDVFNHFIYLFIYFIFMVRIRWDLNPRPPAVRSEALTISPRAHIPCLQLLREELKLNDLSACG